MGDVLFQTDIPSLPCRRGKVRDLYDLGAQLLIVACDRISAFDVVLPNGIPQKGVMLTRLSEFWFDQFTEVPNHFIEVIDSQAPPGLERYRDQLRGRAMLCRKCDVVPIECVVRGYLAGSAWREYLETQSVCGIKLPAGMQQCQQILPDPIFTPATKAEEGHDENISFEQACSLVGADVMAALRARSIEIYRRACDFARARGVMIADTKFEWGRIGDEYILIDEVLTPDSSRFWPAANYQVGRDQVSWDKQYVRNYLQGLCDAGTWDKQPPGPPLPAEVVANTAQKYAEACQILTGRPVVEF